MINRDTKLTPESPLLPPITDLIFQKTPDIGELINNLKEDENILNGNFKNTPKDSESKNFYNSLNSGMARSKNLMLELSKQPRSYNSLQKTATDLKKQFDTAKDFYKSQHEIHNKKKQEIRQQVLNVENKLQNSSHLLKSLQTYTLNSFDPLQQKMNEDPLFSTKKVLVHMSMGIAQAIAPPIKLLGEGFSAGIHYACDMNDTTRKVCKVTKDSLKYTGNQLLRVMKQTDIVNKAQAIHKFVTVTYPIEMDRRYLVPQETTHQYVQDLAVIVPAVIPIPFLPRFSTLAKPFKGLVNRICETEFVRDVLKMPFILEQFKMPIFALANTATKYTTINQMNRDSYIPIILKKESESIINRSDSYVGNEAVALRVNKVSNGYFQIPNMKEISNHDIGKLHSRWEKNNQTLLGIIAEEEIPSGIGLLGAPKRLYTKILEEHCSLLNPQQDFISVTGLRYSGKSSLNPITTLADFYSLSIETERSMNLTGGRLIMDISTAQWMNKPITLSRSPLLTLSDGLNDKVFLDLIGRDFLSFPENKVLAQGKNFIRSTDIPNADRFHLTHITPDNYQSLIKGMIPIEQSVIPMKAMEFYLKNPANPKSILANRFKHQEVVMEVLAQLNSIHLENASWKRYQKTGSALMGNYEAHKMVPLTQFYESHKYFLSKYKPNTSEYKALLEHPLAKRIQISPKQGEIYWVDLSPSIGFEANKIRPCIVTSVVHPGDPIITVTPITSQVKSLGSKDVKCLLNGKQSKIDVRQSRAVDICRFDENKGIIGKVDSLTMEAISKARDYIFNFSSTTGKKK